MANDVRRRLRLPDRITEVDIRRASHADVWAGRGPRRGDRAYYIVPDRGISDPDWMTVEGLTGREAYAFMLGMHLAAELAYSDEHEAVGSDVGRPFRRFANEMVMTGRAKLIEEG